jgi:hypothetical protein
LKTSSVIAPKETVAVVITSSLFRRNCYQKSEIKEKIATETTITLKTSISSYSTKAVVRTIRSEENCLIGYPTDKFYEN